VGPTVPTGQDKAPKYNFNESYSKLQLPDEYLELIRVIVWHNRQRLKMELPVLKPREFVEFLCAEMAQDFNYLQIDIQDFLDDLIKIRYSENLAFDTYNNYIQNQKVSEKISPSKLHYKNNNSSSPNLSFNTLPKDEVISTTRPSDKKSAPNTPSTTPASDKKKAPNTSSPTPNIHPTNLLRKFISVTDTTASQSSTLNKLINLKNKENHRHIHRYDLRIGIKECRSEEEEQKVLQNLLEEFLDTMLSADKSILIPPYFELDRANTNFQDLSSSYKISDTESFSKLKRDFS
jgi:hypothetical protein